MVDFGNLTLVSVHTSFFLTMKSVAIIFLALFAMSFAQSNRVRVAQGPGNLNIDNAFYRPTVGQPGGPAANIRPNNDAYFSQVAGGNPTRPNFGPTFVNNQNYPPKYQQNPLARGGK